MITIIRCTTCGGESNLIYKLIWKYDESFCENCHHYESKEREYHFCSDDCLKKFVDKFANHKCIWENEIPIGVLNEKGVIKAKVRCRICNRTIWKKVSKKVAEEFKKQWGID